MSVFGESLYVPFPKNKTMAHAKGFLRIAAMKAGKEACVFCHKPHAGHLISEFSHSLFKGVALTVCKSCENKKRDVLSTTFTTAV